jgi:hypothetical protein
MAARDLVVNLVGRAISTGMPYPDRPRAIDERFYAGRSTAFVQAAAMAAESAYGCDVMAAQHWLNRRVRDVRRTWNPVLLRDGELVGKEATTILDDMLATVPLTR